MRRSKFKMNFKEKLFVGVVALACIQFFWVLARYQIIESNKVFWWTIKYILPFAGVVGVFLFNPLEKMMFRDYYHKSDNKLARLRGKLASFSIVVLLIIFYGYNTIIQTNDWFGETEYFEFNTEVLSSKKVQHGRRRARRRGGNTTYDIVILYKGKPILLSCDEYYYPGEIFDKNLNVGGFWGVIYL